MDLDKADFLEDVLTNGTCRALLGDNSGADAAGAGAVSKHLRKRPSDVARRHLVEGLLDSAEGARFFTEELAYGRERLFLARSFPHERENFSPLDDVRADALAAERMVTGTQRRIRESFEGEVLFDCVPRVLVDRRLRLFHFLNAAEEGSMSDADEVRAEAKLRLVYAELFALFDFVGCDEREGGGASPPRRGGGGRVW